MLFQTFDEKEKCVAIYANDKIHFKKIPKNLTETWSYSAFLKDYKDIEYAQIYCAGKTLDEMCPEYLRKEWEKVNSRLKAFYRSCSEAKLDLSQHCFFELVPQTFLKDYAKVKNAIAKYVLVGHKKPENYDFSLSLVKTLTDMKYKKLNTDFNSLNDSLHKFKVRRFVKKNKHLNHVKYDMYKTKTGRLSTLPESFPILTMDKNYRRVLRPNNDWFLEFDFNAMELRVMLALLSKDQPTEDLHEWNVKNVYKNSLSREEAKKRIFAWLYNPGSRDPLSNSAYNRDEILKKHWDGTRVKTCFNKEIEADSHHALNYIIQSTAADLFLQQMVKIFNKLDGKKSYISFCMHDSLIMDFSEEDQFILNELKKDFAKTELGKFRVNVSAGKNYGDMKKLLIY